MHELVTDIHTGSNSLPWEQLIHRSGVALDQTATALFWTESTIGSRHTLQLLKAKTPLTMLLWRCRTSSLLTKNLHCQFLSSSAYVMDMRSVVCSFKFQWLCLLICYRNHAPQLLDCMLLYIAFFNAKYILHQFLHCSVSHNGTTRQLT